jgi:hypothetical protein
MNIFLSGSRKDLERCEHWRDEIVKAGHHITCDWMADVRQFPDNELNEYKCLELAMKDRQGIKSCDLFWLLLPETEGAGCFVELGLAIQMNKTIVISGPFKRTIFEYLANCNVALDGIAFRQIEKFVEDKSEALP